MVFDFSKRAITTLILSRNLRKGVCLKCFAEGVLFGGNFKNVFQA